MPGWDERYATTFGATFDQVGVEGLTSMTSKLRSAGLPMESLPGPPLLPPGLTRWNSHSEAALWPEPGSSVCAKAHPAETPRPSRCCSTWSGARSTQTMA